SARNSLTRAGSFARRRPLRGSAGAAAGSVPETWAAWIPVPARAEASSRCCAEERRCAPPRPRRTTRGSGRPTRRTPSSRPPSSGPAACFPCALIIPRSPREGKSECSQERQQHEDPGRRAEQQRQDQGLVQVHPEVDAPGVRLALEAAVRAVASHDRLEQVALPSALRQPLLQLLVLVGPLGEVPVQGPADEFLRVD